jgi:hypothetical protein
MTVVDYNPSFHFFSKKIAMVENASEYGLIGWCFTWWSIWLVRSSSAYVSKFLFHIERLESMRWIPKEPQGIMKWHGLDGADE